MPLYRYYREALGDSGSRLTDSTALVSLLSATGYVARPWHPQQGEYTTEANDTPQERVVVAYLSQSEPVHCTEVGPFYQIMIPPDPTRDGSLLLWQRNGSGPTAATSTTPTLITALNKRSVNPAMVILSNALEYITTSEGMTGKDFLLIEMGESGTGRFQMQSDEDNERIWNRSFDMISECVALLGKYPDRIGEFWWAKEAALQESWGRFQSPLYFGQRENGDTHPLGTINPDATGTAATRVDHCIWDFSSSGPSDLGRGAVPRTVPLDVAYHDIWDGEVVAKKLGVDKFLADSRFIALGGAVSPQASMWYTEDGSHPGHDKWAGHGEAALMFFLPPMLRAAGIPVSSPKIGNLTLAPGGTYAELSLVGGNGGTLSTKRLVHGLEPPEGWESAAHWQEVCGFNILRAGDAFSQMFFICRPGIDPAIDQKYLGTVAIVGGKIRITPVVPFSTGDMIYPQRPSMYRWSDYDVSSFPGRIDRLDFPVEHIPEWYDASSPWGFSGWEIEPWVGPWKVGEVAPSTYFTTVGNGPVFRDNANIPANTTKIRHKIVIRIPDAADYSNKTSQLFDVEARGFDVRLVFGNEGINLQDVRDSAGADCKPSGVGMGMMPRNVWTTLEFYVDFNEGTTGTFAFRFNGGNWTKRALSQKGAGVFASNRRIRLHGVPTTLTYTLGAGAQVAEHEVWITTGGVETSRMRIAGNAATVNASSFKDPASGNAV